MRLIDADALLQHTYSAVVDGVETDIIDASDVDNAPTVTVDNYSMGYQDGVRKVLSERPQGEWIYGEDDCGQDGWFCSECGFFVPWYYQYYEKDINFIRDYKACPHCLAEMVTYTGKDRDMRGKEE